MNKTIRQLLWSLCGLTWALHAAALQPSLPPLGVDDKAISVSGISSGGFMTVQFEVAHSATVMGAGVIAGGPYWCAGGNLLLATTLCSCTAEGGSCINGAAANVVPTSIWATTFAETWGQIDPSRNLARHRVWVYSGGADHTVPKPVVDALTSYYQHYIPAGQIKRRHLKSSGHAQPTQRFGNACATSDYPFINKCKFDGAGELLTWIYPGLSPSTSADPQALQRFDQTEFHHRGLSFGLDDSGWVYIPSACKGAQAHCKLHVVFHGCRQGQSFVQPPGTDAVGATFVAHAGYNEWAQANDIVVLYPQVKPDETLNPRGCWDFWGYSNPNYATQAAGQIATVKAMIDRLVAPAQP